MSESKVPITLSHRAPGIQPPVYVAGSFSNPQWVPVAMDYTTGEDGVHTFTKTLEVEPKSKIAYKYRVGDGDWWILNEDAPTITDDAGNRNNFFEAPEAPEAPEPTKAPEAKSLDEKSINEVPAVESTESTTEGQNSTTDEDTNHVTNNNTHETRPVPMFEALKQPEHIDRWNTHTPEVAAEVADSAALLDLPTPEPEASDELVDDTEAELPLAISDIAEKAAEADIAAEVADTAETLDADENETGSKTEPSSAAPAQDSADVAAEVADTAEALDADEPKIHVETAPPAYQSLADVKADIKDDSLDIAGYSNDPEPVPLFAHECAGLYEDDEIPGATGDEESDKGNARPREHIEDFEDPTLEKFPSRKHEIISAVRKVETGLNADQTSVEGVPPSPLFKSRHSSVAENTSDHSEPSSPTSARGQQNLSLPPSLSQESSRERSLSATSLHSIAEGVEGDDTEKPKGEDAKAQETPESKAEEIAPLVEKAETADEAIQVAKEAEGDAILTPQKPTLASLITVRSPSTKATTGLLSPVSDEDEAVSLKSGKGKVKGDESPRPGYLTPERAATPKPEEPGSPREPPPNAADPDPIPDYDLETSAPKSDLTSAVSEPRSPQIVVSKAEETQPDADLLPAPSLSENGYKKDESTNDEEAVETTSNSEDAGDNKSAAASKTSKDPVEDSNGAEVLQASGIAEGAEAGNEVEAIPQASSLQQTGSHTVTAATSSAFEDNQAGSLKKRSVAKPKPAERTDTPNSITGTHREAAKSRNWFSAFFRLIFIDLVGGFVSRLCGGRRKT